MKLKYQFCKQGLIWNRCDFGRETFYTWHRSEHVGLAMHNKRSGLGGLVKRWGRAINLLLSLIQSVQWNRILFLCSNNNSERITLFEFPIFWLTMWLIFQCEHILLRKFVLIYAGVQQEEFIKWHAGARINSPSKTCVIQRVCIRRKFVKVLPYCSQLTVF